MAKQISYDTSAFTQAHCSTELELYQLARGDDDDDDDR